MATNQIGYIGAGPVFFGLREGGPMRFVGQVPEFKLTVTETTKELNDYVKGTGTSESVSFISKVTADITFASMDAKNLALAMQGLDTPSPVAAVVNEPQVAYPGGLIVLQGIAPTAVTINVAPDTWAASTAYTVGQLVKPAAGTHFYKCKVAGTSDAATPTWKTDGTDTTDGATVIWTDMGLRALAVTEYETNSGGIYILPSCVRVDVAGTPVQVSYTPSAGTNIQTLVDTGREYRILFAGKNLARQGKGMKVEIYRCTISPTKDMSLIGEDFTKMQLTATVLADDTKGGDGISSFCQIDVQAV
jgi:hypothetical protein